MHFDRTCHKDSSRQWEKLERGCQDLEVKAVVNPLTLRLSVMSFSTAVSIAVCVQTCGCCMAEAYILTRWLRVSRVIVYFLCWSRAADQPDTRPLGMILRLPRCIVCSGLNLMILAMLLVKVKRLDWTTVTGGGRVGECSKLSLPCFLLDAL